MDSPHPIPTRIWLVGFRILSLGLMIMGILGALAGVVIAVVSLLPRTQPSPGLTLGYGVLYIVVGITFIVIAFRSFKIRTFRDLELDIAKTANDRERLERWINR